MPGSTPEIDEEARLHCPRCGSHELTAGAPVTDPAVAWTNHSITCRSCGTTRDLAVVAVFGRVVVRWLDETTDTPRR